ncbi:S41 family peptidase [Geotoga petraea]|jgi:hypothetical protein|uniref:Tail specific protease domain-containing protein n=1 Tax=Geotoga petraea TaxID=28234 RepID=A0A4Z0W4H4_9BACT|nr:S41 family peptidase [Geotoga petraea]TGG88736.1 hypothetical protein E4650_00610 [Geotoga petraea]
MKRIFFFSVIVLLIIIFLGFAFDLIGVTKHFGENIFYVGNQKIAIENHIEKEYKKIIEEYNKNYKNDNLSFFNFFVDTIEESYVFLDEKENIKGFSFEELKNFYKSKVSLSNSNEEFDYLVFEMQSILNDPNLRVTGIMKDIKTIPINFDFTNKGLYVNSFNISYFLENASAFDIREGLKIKSIDGDDALEIYEKVKNMTFYKNLNSQEFENIFFASYYNYFRKKEGFTEITFTDTENEYTLNIEFSPYNEIYNMGNFITEERKNIKGIESKIIGENIGYLKIDSLDFANFQETLSKEMEKIALTKILIVDMRNITGENMSNVKYFLSYFENDAIFAYSEQSVNHHLSVISNKSLEEREGLTPLKTFNSTKKYNKELIFIVDETHNNHKNLMISYFSELNYTHFIGENFVLHDSESMNIETPWGYNFLMPYLLYYDVNKKLIEGEKFEVDVVIPFVNTQIIGEDFYIETAFNYALTLIE